MTEQQFGYVLAPRHFVTCLERQAYVVGIERSGVVGNVSQRHVGVQEFKRFLLVGCKFLLLGVVEFLSDSLYALVEQTFHSG